MDKSNEYGSMNFPSCMMGGFGGLEPDMGMGMPNSNPMQPMMTPQPMPYMGQNIMPYADNPMMHMEYMYMYYKYMCKYMEYMEKAKEYNNKNK